MNVLCGAGLASILAITGCATPPSGQPMVAATGDDWPAIAANDTAWREIPATPEFGGALRNDGSVAAPVSTWRTSAKVAWTPSTLWVRIESLGPAPASDFRERDALLHKADVIELFLDVTGERRRIIEVQVNPHNVVADYLHVWDQPPTYLAHQIDGAFFKANHHADLEWNFEGLQTWSVVEPVGDAGDTTRWTVTMAVPLGDALAAEGRSAKLRPGQSVYVNLLRYAYSDEGGKRKLHQYSLVPVRHGCPHQSPMGVLQLTALRGGAPIHPVEGQP